jgi:MerR family transcriptional regulator, light-induced transcriptional regulator
MVKNEHSLQEYQDRYLHYLLSGKHRECSDLVHGFVSQGNSIKHLYENIIKFSLYEVGRLWEQNKISIATEHMASSIVEANLNEIYPSIISSEKKEKTAIVSCIESEMHQIGVKMVGDILEMQGWNVHFLGANTPTNDLFSLISTIQPQLLGISLSIYFHIPNLEKVLSKATAEFPDIKVLVGGQAFQHGGSEILSKYPNVYFGHDLSDVEEYITTN